MRFTQIHSKTLLFLLAFNVWDYPLAGQERTKNLWPVIAPFFTPPAEYEDNFGSYRSPLVFYNGDTVKTPQDWALRRKEIYDTWTNMLGQWPEILYGNTLSYIDTVFYPDYTEYKVKFFWTPSEQTTGYLLIPETGGEKPAVITVYYEPETAVGKSDMPHRDFARQLTQRGFVTLSVGTTESTQAKTYSLFYPDIRQSRVQPLSMLAYAAANAWQALAKVKDVDSARIGIAGHSFGGKWAMFASCLYDKFACAAWSDPGIVFDESRPGINYWEPYYLGYHAPPWRERGVITKENPAHGLYMKLREEGYDLHELHALMAPRPFLVSGGTDDPPERWIALNHTIAVNRLLGYRDKVAMTNRETHRPDEFSNRMLCDFFSHFLDKERGGILSCDIPPLPPLQASP
jgi:dienelactone hydrolase